MTTTTAAAEVDRALKAKHRAMWALGDYPALADDLTPEMLEAGRARAAAQGVDLEWREADAEALPFADDQFDIVMSCLGVMFAPHHQASADEMLRVCRPGGTIGLLSWTPEGFIGQMLATMKPFAPPPPPGAQPPPLWGREDHVRALLGDRVTSITARRQALPVEAFPTPEAFRDYFKARYGPVIATYRSIANDPGRVTALDDELADLARRHDHGTEATVMHWEYLLLTARKPS
jgi:ubiquinone/menaquinone biosynthesis C-methylase UbiE